MESFSYPPTTIKQRWLYLIGNPSEFALEARIFHSISLGIALLAFAYIPYDVYAGLYIAAVSCVFFSCIFFYEYYRSRFVRKPHRSVLFGIAGLVLLSINYFANSGLEGSTDLIWPVYLLLLLTICSYRHIIMWVIIYLVVFGLVHIAENLYPELVQYPFSAGNGQFTDRITAFPLPVVGMAIIIGLLRRNYDKERTIATLRDREKNRLLSILSHDLRAPFIQIQQYFELLNSNVLSKSDRDHFERALKLANDQTLHLVTNLLYWSRSQMDGFSMQLTKQSLSSTLENTLGMANGICNEKSITLTTNIHPDIKVTADADMLQLVVRNLLQNAIKFTTSGGMISVKTETTGTNCLISVMDSGTGISPEQIGHIFSGATPTYGTANERGVGLGLQLCKEFMERQGGSISVESEPEKGSQFTIRIPLAS